MLELSGVTKAYTPAAWLDPTKRALDAVSLSVPARQFTCLLGASGCGKTTLLRIVAGLTAADAGTVAIDGRISRKPGSERSMVFQQYGLLPWRTVLGNVELGMEIQGIPTRERRLRAADFITRVGLAGYEKHYPHQLSGGMQQRVALARAFSKHPKILLMDEPFAAVDMQTREMLQNELRRIWSTLKTTVLFVTHSIEEAVYLGDRVIVMAPGPGRICMDILIDLPREADNVKASPMFGKYCAALRDALRPASAGGEQSLAA